MESSPDSLDESSKNFIREAADYLENPKAWIRVASALGAPLERSLTKVPERVRNKIVSVTQSALTKALQTALISLPSSSLSEPKSLVEMQRASRFARLRHGAGTFVSGALGGAMGWPGLAVEIPLTTTLMLRGIATMARNAGMDLEKSETRLECLSILSLGSPSKSDDAANTSYYEARIALRGATEAALAYLQKHSAKQAMEALTKKSAAPLARWILAIAERFEIMVSEKVLAESVPIIGALGGGSLNLLFTEHFNRVAYYHFGLRKLESQHGEETVKQVYRDALRARAKIS